MTRSAIVNAFTSRPFGGNPAGVVLVPPGAATTDAWMQSVASQYGLSETAFLVDRGDGSWRLRWFTPTVEVELCGHATLAAAHWLWEQNLAPLLRPICFATASGTLTAEQRGPRILLDFPLRPVVSTDPPPGWREALPGIVAEWVGSTTERLATEQNSLILTTAADLHRLQPDLGTMRSTPVAGWIVTAPGESDDAQVLSRYFAPAMGVDEDPVTGSAHCALAGYWTARLNCRSFRARQVSTRGGDLEVVLRSDDRVGLLGQAVTFANGELLV